jgi:signal transduction histidine kinase
MTRPLPGRSEPAGDRAARDDERFLHSQRLETLGIVAAQVAHDLNNVLVSILGDADLLADELAPGDPVRERIADIAAAGRDARALVRQLMSLAGSSSTVTSVDPAILVGEVMLMFRAIAPADVVIDWQPNADIPPVAVDAVQIRQAVLNLLMNAAAAIDHGGTIRISLAHVAAAGLGGVAFVTRARPVRGRSYVAIDIEDSGAGMPAEVLARAFEPFFTTRIEGTGLGLPAVLAAVTKHEGLVAAASTPGNGSRFTIYLPVERGQ